MSDYRPTDLGPPPSPGGRTLVARAKAILLTPREEWPRIDARPETIGEIYKSYVLPLAAIGPVAGLIGGLVFGYGAFGITYRPSVGGALTTAIVSYGATLLGTYVLALIIDALAPTFNATPNKVQAFKVAAYGATAGWVAGIFQIIPSLGFLALLGLYSLYLVYLGLPILMKAPADKAMSYVAVVLLVTFVVGLVVGAIGGAIASQVAPRYSADSGGTVTGALTVPGVGTVDLAKIEAASKQMEAGSKGEGPPAIAPDVLQSMLPASLPGGFTRTSIESSSAGAAGIGGSTAEAAYDAGDQHVTLKITDMAAMGGLAALGSAFNVQSSKQTATGYEKTGTVDGRMTSEKYDSSDKSGSFSTLVGSRVMVEAEGTGTSIDTFKGAVAAIDIGKLEGLVKR